MKKLILGSTMLLLTATLFAQSAPPQRQGHPKPPSVEDRWKGLSERFQYAFHPSTDQEAKLKTVFMEFFKEMDALHEKSQGKRPERTEVDAIVKKRNDAVYKILNKDQGEHFYLLQRELMAPPPPPPPASPEGLDAPPPPPPAS